MKKTILIIGIAVFGILFPKSLYSQGSLSKFMSNFARAYATSILDSAYTPFPQSGIIPVYKYSLGQKQKIGELKWTASLQKGNNSKWGDYTEISIHVTNTTNEWVEGSFYFIGVEPGVQSFTVGPDKTWESGTLIKGAKCTGVKPDRDEITL